MRGTEALKRAKTALTRPLCLQLRLCVVRNDKIGAGLAAQVRFWRGTGVDRCKRVDGERDGRVGA